MTFISTNRPTRKPTAFGASGLHTLAKQAPNLINASIKTVPQGQMASMLVHLAAWQYVPSAVITPFTEAQILKHSGLPPTEQRHQVEKEIARQATGAGLHFLQCYGSLSFKDSLKKLSQWGQQLESGGAGFANSFLKPIAKPLGRLFATEANETATSLGLLMTFNAIGYGVLRPLITNGMFFGWMGLEQRWQRKHPSDSPALASSLTTSSMATPVIAGASPAVSSPFLSATSTRPLPVAVQAASSVAMSPPVLPLSLMPMQSVLQ